MPHPSVYALSQSSMSFLSVEPQSRAVLENYSNSLLAQLDSQLGIISDRYLAFFRERRTIEETYIDSLRKLHLKAKTVDASLDSRAETTTTRAAWDKVTDNLERQANIQRGFVVILDNDIIKPLTTFKKTKDDARKRIEEDLKKSAAEYADHAENKISKLQEAYFKKYHPRFRSRQDDFGAPKLSKSEEVSDIDFRLAVALLNDLRVRRVEYLVDGYDCLDELVFAPITKNVIVKYMNVMNAASVGHDNLARSTRVEVETALSGRDASESDLRASFRRTLSLSIPPPTFYRDYRPGSHSNLIFGVPLVDVETNEDNVPKVMSMCIKEVEKSGLNTREIYSISIWNTPGGRAQVRQLRHRFESEKSLSFRPTDGIHYVAALLMSYIWDLPEPLFSLSLQEYRNYRQIRAKYIENDFSLLRSKIYELHPVQRASLAALLRHLLLVASHSDQNKMTVDVLVSRFCNLVFRGNNVLQGDVHMKALVMVDLIRNVHTLFDERPSTPPPVPSPHASDTTSPGPKGSVLSAELPHSSVDDAIRNRSGPVDVIPTSTQSSFTSLPSDVALENRFTPSPPARPSRPLVLPSSNTVVERAETASQDRVSHNVTDTEAGEASVNSPPEVVAAVVAEWRLRQSQLPPQPEAVTIPQSPSESVFSSSSDLPLSSVMSL
ncbi:hypothetical protein EI94DRAFT_1748379 [Lactarius quietus]|nr:hypothetical protein EI94DRAFT_1748379 [Lactarius quietus]